MVSARTLWIDYAKAIGIILVVYAHVARGLQQANLGTPPPYAAQLDAVIYSFHMPLFFFLSGLFFIHSFSKSGIAKFILGKVDTVLYPYVVWSITQGCIEIFLSSQANSPVTFGEVFSLLWQPRAQFWFLYALFFVFVFSAIVYTISSGRHTLLIFGISIALYLFPTPLSQYMIPNFIFGHFVFFVFGIVFTTFVKIEYFSSIVSLIVTATAFVAGQWIFHTQLAMDYTDKGAPLLVLTCLSILFLVAISAQLSRTSLRFLAHLGACSMAVYLMHILAGSGVRVALTTLLGIDSYAIHLLLGCIAGVVAPLIAFHVITTLKIPGIFHAPVGKWLTNVRRRLPNYAED